MNKPKNPKVSWGIFSPVTPSVTDRWMNCLVYRPVCLEPSAVIGWCYSDCLLLQEAVALLEPMMNDPVNYVRQGALLASALVLVQHTEFTSSKVKDIRQLYAKVTYLFLVEFFIRIVLTSLLLMNPMYRSNRRGSETYHRSSIGSNRIPFSQLVLASSSYRSPWIFLKNADHIWESRNDFNWISEKSEMFLLLNLNLAIKLWWKKNTRKIANN